MSLPENETVRPSGRNFSFDVNLASAYGVEEALLIQHFTHWIGINKSKKVNQYEGRTWTYNTYKEIADHFPFLSHRQVRRTIDNLVHFKVIKKGNFNKMPADCTVWFAFENEEIFVPDLAKPKTRPPVETPPELPAQTDSPPPLPKSATPCRNEQPPAEIGSAIPDTIPVTIPDNKTTNPGLEKNSEAKAGLVGGSSKQSNQIYQCLQKVDIQEKDKIRLCKQYDEAVVSKSVAHCTKPNFKPNITLDSSIFYFCKNPSHITDSKEVIQVQKAKVELDKSSRIADYRHLGNKICETLGKKARQIGVYLFSNNDYLEISNDRVAEKLYYSEEKFTFLLNHSLNKFGVESPSFA